MQKLPISLCWETASSGLCLQDNLFTVLGNSGLGLQDNLQLYRDQTGPRPTVTGFTLIQSVWALTHLTEQFGSDKYWLQPVWALTHQRTVWVWHVQNSLSELWHIKEQFGSDMYKTQPVRALTHQRVWVWHVQNTACLSSDTSKNSLGLTCTKHSLSELWHIKEEFGSDMYKTQPVRALTHQRTVWVWHVQNTACPSSDTSKNSLGLTCTKHSLSELWHIKEQFGSDMYKTQPVRALTHQRTVWVWHV